MQAKLSILLDLINGYLIIWCGLEAQQLIKFSDLLCHYDAFKPFIPLIV